MFWRWSLRSKLPNQYETRPSFIYSQTPTLWLCSIGAVGRRVDFGKFWHKFDSSYRFFSFCFLFFCAKKQISYISRLQNSYNVKDAIEKVFPSTPRYHAAQILCGLLSREKTLIGVMEWEFEGGIDVKNQVRWGAVALFQNYPYKECFQADEQTSIQATIAKIVSFPPLFQKFSGKSQIFRANKLMTSWNLNLDMEACLKQIFVLEDLRKIERVGLMTSATSLTPAASCDSYVPLSGMGIPCGE